MSNRTSFLTVCVAVFFQLGWSGCSSVSRTLSLEESKHSATLMFYNVENLFDTIDDPVKDDDDFLPTAERKWNSEKYFTKLERLGEVISGVGDEFPAIVGLSEVENLNVLEDLAKVPTLKKGKYGAILIEGPDVRGIDVALLYSRKRFKVEKSVAIPVKLPEGVRPTRPILHVTGRFKSGPNIHIFVNHWPSRYGGQEQSEPNRIAAAETLRDAVRYIQTDTPEAYIVCMGDFNDYPGNRSVSEVLNAGTLESPGLLINLMKDREEDWRGSYNYRGEWGFLDQIMVSTTLVDGLIPDVLPEETGVYFTEEMIYTNEEGEEYPARSYGGTNYYGGYSDHLPVYTILKY